MDVSPGGLRKSLSQPTEPSNIGPWSAHFEGNAKHPMSEVVLFSVHQGTFPMLLQQNDTTLSESLLLTARLSISN